MADPVPTGSDVSSGTRNACRRNDRPLNAVTLRFQLDG